MASFDLVNYSLRPSKNIQRQIVFDGVSVLQSVLDLDRLAYIGFGSIWFTDFVLAHKMLKIDDMFSIEADDIGYRRAVFNSPYATVRVRHGFASNILPTLFTDDHLVGRPWMIWLDYDREYDETLRDNSRSVVERAPTNSILLVTFNANEMKYGHAPDRPTRLRQIFGDVVPDDLSKNACKDERMQETLASLAIDFMSSVAADVARPGGFVPAFRLIYKDTSPMVTVGGLLPTRGALSTALEVVRRERRRCCPEKAIVAPHLTMREVAVLQSQLPRAGKLSRAIVQSLGFDLGIDQIEAFEAYYRHYPAFAQVVS